MLLVVLKSFLVIMEVWKFLLKKEYWLSGRFCKITSKFILLEEEEIQIMFFEQKDYSPFNCVKYWSAILSNSSFQFLILPCPYFSVHKPIGNHFVCAYFLSFFCSWAQGANPGFIVVDHLISLFEALVG